MVLAVLCEQYLPSHRGIARNRESLAAGNDRGLWQQHHYRNTIFKRPEHVNKNNIRRNSILDLSEPEDGGKVTSDNKHGIPVPTTASIRPKRNRFKASKLLASLAADFDVLTDWLFYFHCHTENAEHFENEGKYLLPHWMVGIVLASSLIGTTLWLILATDGAIATPVLRFLGYDKLSLGHILLACVLFEDLPQVILTFFIEDYFEADQEFNNYAVMNVISSLYDIMIKLAEAYDQRADIVETGHWNKDNIHAHEDKIICLVPIPAENSNTDGVTAGSVRSSLLSSTSDSSILSSTRDSISAFSTAPAEANSSSSNLFQNRLHVSNKEWKNSRKRRRKRTLFQEAQEMVADTKLPSMRFLSASKDGTVKLWDTSLHEMDEKRQRQPREIFAGHQTRVSCISFVGKLNVAGSYHFLTGSYDGTSKLWTIDEKECLKTYNTVLLGEESTLKLQVTSIAYMDCGDEGHTKAPFVSTTVPMRPEYFVNGYKSGKVRLWDLWSETCLRIFEEPKITTRRFLRLPKKKKSRIYSLCSMEDSRHFVAGSLDGVIRMWDVGIHDKTYHSEREITTIVEADESKSDDLTMAISTNKRPAQVFLGHTSIVFSIKCVSPGSVLLSGSQDRTAKLWSVSTGACLKTFSGHTGPIHDVAIVDQVTFLTASRDNLIMAWDAISGQAFRTYENYRGSQYPVTTVATGDQSGCFLSGDEQGNIGLWIFSAVHDQHDRANLLEFDDDLMVCGGCQDDEESMTEEMNDVEGYTIIL